MSNQHPAPEDYASSAYDDEEDEDGSSEGGEEEDGGVVAETQPAQRQQLPILTSPISDERRYQLRSTPDQSQRAQQQQQQQQQPRYPFVNAARVRGLGGATTINRSAGHQ